MHPIKGFYCGRAQTEREESQQRHEEVKVSAPSPLSDQPPVRDQAAQAANYSNYDSLLPEINLIKRRLSRAR